MTNLEIEQLKNMIGGYGFSANVLYDAMKHPVATGNDKDALTRLSYDSLQHGRL